MLPFQNFGGKNAFKENLNAPLANVANHLESSFNLNTTSALPSSNLSFYAFPYFNSPASYQPPSASTLPNFHDNASSTFIQFSNDASTPCFLQVFNPSQQQSLFSSFVQPQQSSNQQTSFIQKLPNMQQNLANLLQRSLSQEPTNPVSQPQQYPSVETAFIQPDQIQKSKLRTPSLSLDKNNDTKQSQIQVQLQYSQQPSLDDINRPSTELCIQGGGQEQVLPRSLSDTQARGEVERFEIERTTSDFMVRLKRKLDSSDQIKFVENLTDLKSNLASNQTSSLCSFRKWKQGDSPLILLMTMGASMNTKTEVQAISPSERSKRCSIFQENHPNQSISQHSEININSKLQNDISREDALPNISLKRNLSRQLETASSYKKELLDELSIQDQCVISEMKQSKKYNFSKNVIKQFLKVQLKASYIYQSDSSNAGEFHLNTKPSFERLLEFRKQLREYIAGCSFNHSAIKRIIQHPYFSLYFRDFLRDHSEEWLAIGKTKYKHEQHIMVQFLQLCIKNPKLLIFLSEHDYCSKH